MYLKLNSQSLSNKYVFYIYTSLRSRNNQEYNMMHVESQDTFFTIQENSFIREETCMKLSHFLWLNFLVLEGV